MIRTWGDPPSPRYFHSCAFYGKYVPLRCSAGVLVQPFMRQGSGDVPAALTRSRLMSVWPLPMCCASSFYVFGGYNGSERLNDFHEYSFDTNSYVHVSSDSSACVSFAGRC